MLGMSRENPKQDFDSIDPHEGTTPHSVKKVCEFRSQGNVKNKSISIPALEWLHLKLLSLVIDESMASTIRMLINGWLANERDEEMVDVFLELAVHKWPEIIDDEYFLPQFNGKGKIGQESILPDRLIDIERGVHGEPDELYRSRASDVLSYLQIGDINSAVDLLKYHRRNRGVEDPSDLAKSIKSRAREKKRNRKNSRNKRDARKNNSKHDKSSLVAKFGSDAKG